MPNSTHKANTSCVVLIFCALSFFPQHPAWADDSLDYLLRAMVKIQVYTTEKLSVDEDGIVEKHFSYGSGFYISSDGLVLTAAHVIKKATKLSRTPISCIRAIDGNVSGGLLLVSDEEQDLALLQDPAFSGSSKNKYFINMNSKASNLRIGMPCFCLGFPNEIQKFGKIYSISNGELTEFSRNLPGHQKLEWRRNLATATCEVVSGFSGGLVFDDLFMPIGIVVGAYEKKGQNLCLIRRVRDIRKFLKNANVEVN